MDCINEILRIIDYQKYLIDRAKKSLEDSPAGRLEIRRKEKGERKYFNDYEEVDSFAKTFLKDWSFYNIEPVTGKYLNIGNNPALIEKLIYKKLSKHSKKVAVNNIKVLEKILRKLENPNRQNLLSPKEANVLEWIKTHRLEEMNSSSLSNKHYKLNERTHETMIDGIFVRSKGEQLIVNQLAHSKIPFVYERPISISTKEGMKTLIPDFTIINLNGEKIIWEHLGLMNSHSYVESFARKISYYYDGGYTLGDNLIVTSDDKNGNCSSMNVCKIIENYLIPFIG